jgi:hypothetical protein
MEQHKLAHQRQLGSAYYNPLPIHFHQPVGGIAYTLQAIPYQDLDNDLKENFLS